MNLSVLPVYVEGFTDSRNLRDLGGWPTADGRRILRGAIYRSGRLCDLSLTEHKHLASLNLRTVLDLRSSEERSRHPDDPIYGVQTIHVDAKRRLAGEQLPQGATFEDLVRDKAQATAEMAFGSPALKTVFSLLLAYGRTPLLVHCNSGKDRTGVIAMVILLALGASDETIMADYLLSNAYRHAEIAWSKSRITGYDRLSASQQDMLTVLQGVIPLVAQTVLDCIDARYPSRERYLEAECGVDGGALAELRKRYLCQS